MICKGLGLVKAVFASKLLRDSKGICKHLLWILFGSRSVPTERDPNKIRRSSEGDPLESRIQPMEIDVRYETTTLLDLRQNTQKRKQKQVLKTKKTLALAFDSTEQNTGKYILFSFCSKDFGNFVLEKTRFENL